MGIPVVSAEMVTALGGVGNIYIKLFYSKSWCKKDMCFPASGQCVCVQVLLHQFTIFCCQLSTYPDCMQNRGPLCDNILSYSTVSVC